MRFIKWLASKIDEKPERDDNEKTKPFRPGGGN